MISNIPSFTNEVNPDYDSDEQNNDQPENEKAAQALEAYGQLLLPKDVSDIHVITVIGQVEGHLVMPSQNKTTKYEHIIPQLVAIEQNPDIKGLMIILNTVGGDVEAGLALAEMISTMTKPTVSIVLGGGHSIGVPIAVAADRSFIASTGTMTIHPIRITGLVVSAQQSWDYLEKMQDRVVKFITTHSDIPAREFKRMMMTTGELARDVGTVIVGEGAVDCGLIDEVGGLDSALKYLRERIVNKKDNDEDNSNKNSEDRGDNTNDLEHNARRSRVRRRR